MASAGALDSAFGVWLAAGAAPGATAGCEEAGAAAGISFVAATLAEGEEVFAEVPAGFSCFGAAAACVVFVADAEDSVLPDGEAASTAGSSAATITAGLADGSGAADSAEAATEASFCCVFSAAVAISTVVGSAAAGSDTVMEEAFSFVGIGAGGSAVFFPEADTAAYVRTTNASEAAISDKPNFDAAIFLMDIPSLLLMNSWRARSAG